RRFRELIDSRPGSRDSLEGVSVDARRVKIHLDLRLGSARARDDARTVGKPETQDVAGFKVCDTLSKVVELHDATAREFARRRLSNARHDARNLVEIIDAHRDLPRRERAEPGGEVEQVRFD